MEGFVEDMLNMQLMRDGLFEFQYCVFNLRETLDFVVAMFECKAKSFRINLSHVYDTELASETLDINSQLIMTTTDALPRFLLGDPRRLKQVLINLVKNAIKFTKDGFVQIRVFYNYFKSELHVRVVDSGLGIAQEDMSRLFTRFGKLQRTAAMNHEGIGLGLNISKKIVEKAGGSIRVHSKGLGYGSEFSFYMKMEIGREKNAQITKYDNPQPSNIQLEHSGLNNPSNPHASMLMNKVSAKSLRQNESALQGRRHSSSSEEEENENLESEHEPGPASNPDEPAHVMIERVRQAGEFSLSNRSQVNLNEISVSSNDDSVSYSDVRDHDDVSSYYSRRSLIHRSAQSNSKSSKYILHFEKA